MDHDIAPLSGHAMRCVWNFPRPVIWIATGFSSAKFFVKILQREFGEPCYTDTVYFILTSMYRAPRGSALASQHGLFLSQPCFLRHGRSHERAQQGSVKDKSSARAPLAITGWRR